MTDELIFRGVRYLRARAEPADSGGFLIVAEEGARPWSTGRPEGWWRNFVEGDIGDAEQVLGLVKKYGFVFAQIDTAPRQELTSRWRDLQTALGLAASAWNTLDPNGISATDETKRKAADESLRPNAFIRERREELSLIHDPAGEPGKLVRQAGSLAAYMVASALHGLEHRLSMRVCLHCEMWFYPGRSDQRFCSDNCRSQYNIKAKLGIVPARSAAR
jgi:hypothetical protein